jgi:hypothetical protein
MIKAVKRTTGAEDFVKYLKTEFVNFNESKFFNKLKFYFFIHSFVETIPVNKFFWLLGTALTHICCIFF